VSTPELLLPDAIKKLWTTGTAEGVDAEALMAEQQRLIGEYADVWANSLMLDGESRLSDSLLAELRRSVAIDDAEIERRWSAGDEDVPDEWRSRVADPTDRRAVEDFYDRSQGYIFELMRWHTLGSDNGPLAYVVALRFAEQRGCRTYLDFGAGVGSGAILFARHGFDVTLADISSTLLDFAQKRLRARQVSAGFLDLKREALPPDRFDMVTAMDVWEHLVDPVGEAAAVARAIKPGGFLFGRFAAEPDPNVPQHIVFDFQPTFEEFAHQGLVRVWEDDWLWGHQAFQKRSTPAPQAA